MSDTDNVEYHISHHGFSPQMSLLHFVCISSSNYYNDVGKRTSECLYNDENSELKKKDLSGQKKECPLKLEKFFRFSLLSLCSRTTIKIRPMRQKAIFSNLYFEDHGHICHEYLCAWNG